MQLWVRSWLNQILGLGSHKEGYSHCVAQDWMLSEGWVGENPLLGSLGVWAGFIFLTAVRVLAAWFSRVTDGQRDSLSMGAILGVLGWCSRLSS